MSADQSPRVQLPRPVSFACHLFVWLLIASSLAIPATADSRLLDLDAISAEIPKAEGIFLQRVTKEEVFAQTPLKTLVAVQWGPEALDRIARESGRMDRVQIGATLFRDDGLGVDTDAGDGLFHAILYFEASRLEAKAHADLMALTRGAREVVHEKRVKMASSPIVPFPFEAFLAGERVELRPSRHVVGEHLAPLTPVDASLESPPGSGSTKAALKVPGTNPFQESTLAIRHPSVVRDFSRTNDACSGLPSATMGPWSFGHLMTEIANHPMYPTPPEAMVEQWLLQWATTQTINSFPAAARPLINNWLNDWKAASGGGALDLSMAPFRLLAILPRVDLRSSAAGPMGPFTNAGEARFVFGAVVPASWSSSGTFGGPVTTGGCELLPFTVIFEYKVPLHTCLDVRAWADSWIHLSTLPLGSSPYLNHLEALTHSFTRRNAWPSRPKGSALGQLRTNENAFNPLWELREFHVDSAIGFLMTETEDNADNAFQGGGLFHDYVAIDFASGAMTEVPSVYMGSPFRTGNPEVPLNFTLLEPLFYWDELSLIPGGFIPERHEVSLASCNGCHGGETATPFVHISPTAPFPPARADLSLFMTGFNQPDPAVDQAIADGRFFGPRVFRPFDALEDREADINSVSAWLCPVIKSHSKSDGAAFALEDLLREPVDQVH